MLVRACLKYTLCTGGHRDGGSTRVGTPARHAYSRGSWERSAVLLAQCRGLFAAQNCPNLAESSVLAYKREWRARPSGFPQLPAPCPLSPGTHSSLPTTLHSLQGKKGRKPPQQAAVELSLTLLRTAAKLTHRWFFLASLFFGDVFSTLSIKLKYCLPGITAHQVLYYRWN